MFNPAHPGEILREEVLKPLGLTITETAQHLGISRKTLSKILNCRGTITAEMAIRLERAFGQPADTWLKMQAAYDLWQARQHTSDIHVIPVDAPTA